jgi:hypothetical protein
MQGHEHKLMVISTIPRCWIRCLNQKLLPVGGRYGTDGTDVIHLHVYHAALQPILSPSFHIMVSSLYNMYCDSTNPKHHQLEKTLLGVTVELASDHHPLLYKSRMGSPGPSTWRGSRMTHYIHEFSVCLRTVKIYI